MGLALDFFKLIKPTGWQPVFVVNGQGRQPVGFINQPAAGYSRRNRFQEQSRN